ncbi:MULTISPECIES: PucR family transcriptional regulator [unclassified Mycobacterium]|uniref:PucR family transcriptional regulator n=1 Tax=Mycobacterium sp. DL99 TaxID=2528957 RepID=UPI001080DDF9|nr:PucR family transcriptional regulator [Mycobacterium sp. DL99]
MEQLDTTTQLIRTTARRLLDVHLDEIVERTVARTIEDEPTYTGGPVSRTDLRYHMDRTMRLALSRLAGDDIPADLESVALELGKIRARQGVPLSSVLHAFRIDLKSLWEALIDEGRAVGADVRADFLERSSLMVWEAVELNTEHVVRGYQTTQDSLDEIRSAAFDQLLTDGGLEPSAVEDAARVLGLPTEGSYHCLVGSFPIPRPEVLAECSAALQASGRAFYFSWWARELRGVVHASDDSFDIAGELAALSGQTCSVVTAAGLDSVARAIRLARMAVHGRSDVGVERLQDNWLHAVVAANQELSEEIHSAVFGPLNRLSESERHGLTETVGDLTANGGTIANIAERTYRHRNTVRGRLRAFTELTGFDLTKTNDLATVTIAFMIDANMKATG